MPEINILGNPLIIFFIAVFVVAVIAFFLLNIYLTDITVKGDIKTLLNVFFNLYT